jgi:hypothetical protein
VLPSRGGGAYCFGGGGNGSRTGSGLILARIAFRVLDARRQEIAIAVNEAV